MASWPADFDAANFIPGVSDLPFGYEASLIIKTWSGVPLPFGPKLLHFARLDSLMGHMVEIPMNLISLVAKETVEQRNPPPPPVPEPSTYFTLNEIMEIFSDPPMPAGAAQDIDQALVDFFGEQPGTR